MVTTKLMTSEELELLPDDEYGYELVRGVLIQMPPPDPLHGERVAQVIYLFKRYQEEFGGRVTGEAGYRFEIDPDTVLGPDVTYTVPSRVSPSRKRGFVQPVPDVVVEIDSPSNRPGGRCFRLTVYFAAGVRFVLFLNDEKQTLTAYHADGRVETLTIGDVFDGGEVMPGFRLAIADLFR